MIAKNKLYTEVKSLSPMAKVEMIDYLYSLLDESDPEIEKLQIREVKSRVSGYKQGKIKAHAVSKLFLARSK